jgi:NAD(P)-dependent dehydrogenase (short-subunit alcohol dehydrogenase family)
MTLLRPGLLTGRSVVLVDEVPASVSEQLSALGAAVTEYGGQADEERALEWAREAAPLHAVVCASGDGLDGVERAWAAIRAVAVGALIPAAGGTIVLLAPRPDALAKAGAVRAALENLARTLSVEWARYGINATAVWPGAKTTEGDLATLIAYLCSRAGEYFSGCRFQLDGL